MSEALEQRMTAMRARLSTLSSAVDDADATRASYRQNAHRYSGAPLEPAKHQTTPQPLFTASQPPPKATPFQERNVNSLGGGGKAIDAVAQHAESHSSRSAVPPSHLLQRRGVETMLQLARQHATQTATASQPTTPPPSSTAHHMPSGDAQRNYGGAARPESSSESGFSGLRTYGFQERFPSPRHVAHPASVQAGIKENVPPSESARPAAAAAVPEVESSSVHKYAQSTASFTSVSSTHSSAQPSDASFDAFRVVKERLRQKMRQLTIGQGDVLAPAAALEREKEATGAVKGNADPGFDSQRAGEHPWTERTSRNVHRAVVEEDCSPPPRAPPGARAQTATPPRSPHDLYVDVSPNTTLPMPSSARSHHERHSHRQAEGTAAAHAQRDRVLRTPIEVELSGAAPSQLGTTQYPAETRLFDPTAGTLSDSVRQEEERDNSYASYHSSQDEKEYEEEQEKAEALRAAPRLPAKGRVSSAAEARLSKPPSRVAQGAFSDPSSFGGAAAERVAQQHRRDSVHRRTIEGSMRSGSRSTTNTGSQSDRGAGLDHAAVQQRSSRSGLRSHSKRGSQSLSSSSRHRERSSTGHHPARTSLPAPRPRPLSLNVEATILADVSGAELFALLRMRNLIQSEGDTEEFRLPPTRCHRLYVTPDEHRQLQLLRQSLHALEEAEVRDVPSYQRPTTAARSRNAEFAPPPPVTRFMDL